MPSSEEGTSVRRLISRLVLLGALVGALTLGANSAFTPQRTADAWPNPLLVTTDPWPNPLGVDSGPWPNPLDPASAPSSSDSMVGEILL
jgi:hypothetical protein